MINLYSSDSEKLFHITIAQNESQFEINCLKYNRFRESMTLIHSSGLWFESKLNQYLLNQINATEPTGLMLEAQEKADLVAFLKTLTDQSYLNNPDFASPF
jgi:hypothetical protein